MSGDESILLALILGIAWIFVQLFGWIFEGLFASRRSEPQTAAGAEEIEDNDGDELIEDYDSNELIDDYDEYEPIETRSSSIPPPLPERPPDELIDDYDEDERVEEANEYFIPASIPRDDPGWWAPEGKGRKRRRRKRR